MQIFRLRHFRAGGNHVACGRNARVVDKRCLETQARMAAPKARTPADPPNEPCNASTIGQVLLQALRDTEYGISDLPNTGTDYRRMAEMFLLDKRIWRQKLHGLDSMGLRHLTQRCTLLDHRNYPLSDFSGHWAGLHRRRVVHTKPYEYFGPQQRSKRLETDTRFPSGHHTFAASSLAHHVVARSSDLFEVDPSEWPPLTASCAV